MSAQRYPRTLRHVSARILTWLKEALERNTHFTVPFRSSISRLRLEFVRCIIHLKTESDRAARQTIHEGDFDICERISTDRYDY